jgi:copper chaperone
MSIVSLSIVSSARQEVPMTTEVIKVEGMTCGHCKMAVERALSSLKGVSSAEVDLSNNTVSVRYDETNVGRDQFAEAIEAEGYSVVPS